SYICFTWGSRTKKAVLSGNSRNCSAAVRWNGDAWTAASRGRSSGERAATASANDARYSRPISGFSSPGGNTKSGIVLSAISTILSFWKFQLEIDVLSARVVQDHRRVIGGTLLFRPHPFHIGTALFQQVRRHLLCQLLFT